MAAIGLDATGFNATANKVLTKSAQMGKAASTAVAQSSSAAKTSIAADMRRTAGLASDPVAFLAAGEREKEMARRRAVTMAQHEVWLAKKKAAAKKAVDDEKALYGGLDRAIAKKSAADALNREMGFVPMAKGANQARESFSALGGAAKMFGAVMTVDFLRSRTMASLEYADKIDGVASRIGITSSAARAWDKALKLNNSSIDDAIPMFERFAIARQKAQQGDQDAIATMSKFGISREDIMGGARNEDLILKVANAFQGGDAQALVADLRKLGGRAAGNLVQAFSQGLGGLVEEYRNSWSALSDVENDESAKLQDQIEKMTQTFGSAWDKVVAHFATRFNSMVDIAGSGWSAITGGAKGFFDGVMAGDFKGAVAGLFTGGAKSLKERKDAIDRSNAMAAGAAKAGADAEIEDTAKIARLKEKLASKENSMAMIGLEPEQKKAELLRRRAELLRQISAEPMEEKRLELRSDVADIEKELMTDADREDKDLARGIGKHSVGSLQQMGGFLGNFQAAGNSELMEAVKTNSLLSEIKGILAEKSGKTESDGVSY